MTIPLTEIERIADLIYGTGTITANFYLTNGLTYSNSTTLANVLANDVLATTMLLPNPALVGVEAQTTVTVVFTNTTGSNVTYSGWAISLDGTTLHDGSNAVSGTIANTATASLIWTGIFREKP